PRAVHVGAVIGEYLQRLGEVDDLHSNLGQQPVGVGFYRRQRLLVEHLVGGELPGEERLRFDECGGPGALARRPSTRTASCRHLRLLSLDLRPPRRLPRRGSLGGRTSERWGNSCELWGMPMAATKCSWNRGSVAVSTFSIRRATSSISPRAEADKRAIIAPLPAAFPAAETRSRSQSGISPRIMAYLGSM